jgi:hypothetical protein
VVLKHICKRYKGIKKTEKEKKKTNKIEKGLGEPLGPDRKTSPRPI